MAESIGGVPVKTRIPFAGWVLAVVLTALSITSSLTQTISDRTVATANASALHQPSLHEARSDRHITSRRFASVLLEPFNLLN